MFKPISLTVLFVGAMLLASPGAFCLVLSSSSLNACVQDGSQVRALIRSPLSSRGLSVTTYTHLTPRQARHSGRPSPSSLHSSCSDHTEHQMSEADRGDHDDREWRGTGYRIPRVFALMCRKVRACRLPIHGFHACRHWGPWWTP